MKHFLRNNGLSLTFLILFFLSLWGQVVTGVKEHNQGVVDMGGKPVNVREYVTSGHFLQATFENWESEFLQMALFLILSMFLYQKGSSESKDPDKQEDVDRQPDPRKKDAPWPVKKILDALRKHGTRTTIIFLAWKASCAGGFYCFACN